VRAFLSVEGWGVHFLAGLEPLAIPDGQLAAARIPAAAAADLLEWGPESTVERQFDRVISHELSIEKMISAAPATPTLTDDEPVNEYFLLRGLFQYYR
jgi:hypothetical protein